MTTSKDKRLPTSITFDPVVRARYKNNRDYYYHEDPVYRESVRKQHASYMNDYKKDPVKRLERKKYNRERYLISTITPKQRQQQLQYNKRKREENKELFKIKRKEQYRKREYDRKKPKLSEGLELREESD